MKLSDVLGTEGHGCQVMLCEVKHLTYEEECNEGTRAVTCAVRDDFLKKISEFSLDHY